MELCVSLRCTGTHTSLICCQTALNKTMIDVCIYLFCGVTCEWNAKSVLGVAPKMKEDKVSALGVYHQSETDKTFQT